jgi:hypothetical protein
MLSRESCRCPIKGFVCRLVIEFGCRRGSDSAEVEKRQLVVIEQKGVGDDGRPRQGVDRRLGIVQRAELAKAFNLASASAHPPMRRCEFDDPTARIVKITELGATYCDPIGAVRDHARAVWRSRIVGLDNGGSKCGKGAHGRRARQFDNRGESP